MAANFFIAAFSCLFLGLNVAALETVNGRLKIQIQTTAGCSDTHRFIVDDLAPTYALYKEFLDVEFVPWGRASRDDDGNLVCQFGPRDCWANRLQRCALELLEDDQDAQVSYMVCENTTPLPSFLLQSYQCAQAEGINLVDLDYCVAHSGEELDQRDEVIGSQHMSDLDFVPSVVFNDIVDQFLHSEALTRFRSLVCLTLAADASTGVTDCTI